MDFSVSSIFAGVALGAFGVFFIRRGKAEAIPELMVLGLILMVLPLFVANVWVLWGVGIVGTYWGLRRSFN